MLGTRGIWHKGWKAVTEHGPVPIGLGNFDEDRWQLFHTDEDRAEAHDLAEQHPGQARGARGALAGGGEEVRRPAAERPLDLRVPGSSTRSSPRAGATERAVHLLPGHREVPEASAAEHDQRLAPDPRRGRLHARPQGVIVAQGSRFGGLLAVRHRGEADLRLQLPRDPAGAADRRRRAVRPGTHVVGVEFTKEGMGEHHEAHRAGPSCTSTTRSSRRRRSAPMPRPLPLCGEGLCIGYDGGDASAPSTRRGSSSPAGDHQGRVRRGRRRLRRRRGPPGRGDGARLRPPPPPAMHARSAGGMWRLSGGGGWGAPSPKGGARGPRRTARSAARSRASARASGCCSSAGR